MLIEAKPLHIKGLRARRDSVDTPKNPSGSTRDILGNKSEINIIDIRPKSHTWIKNKRELVFNVVKLHSGLKAGHVHVLIEDFIKKYKVNDTMSPGSVAAFLKMLVDDGRLGRVKLNDVYFYYYIPK